MSSRVLRSGSLHSIDEADLREILNPKTNTTDKICGILNYINLLPTLVYNLTWLFLLKNCFEENYEVFLNGVSQNTNDCTKLHNSLNTVFIWAIINISKAIFFIVCSNIFCDSKVNDCNILCLVFKVLSTYIPSLYLLSSFEYSTELDQNTLLASISQDENKALCGNLLYYTQKFYYYERSYVILVSSLLIMIPVGSILMALKELWKSKNYVKFDENEKLFY
jgi:hypothetical protein